MKKLIIVALVLCAAPLFAAFQAHIAFKGQKQGKLDGKSMNVSNVGWGMPTAGAVANAPECMTTHEIHFAVPADSVPLFTQALQSNEQIPAMTLDFFNTRHSLRGVTVHAVQGNNVTMHFDGCETHAPQPPAIVAASLVNPNTTARPPNAQVFIDGVPGDRFDLISLQLQGNNTAVLKVREAANGFFQRSAASRKGTPGITFLRFKFDTVFTTKVQWSSDGTETVTLNYGHYLGPAEGFHQ